VIAVSSVERGKSVAMTGADGSIRTTRARASIILKQLLINPVTMVVNPLLNPVARVYLSNKQVY